MISLMSATPTLNMYCNNSTVKLAIKVVSIIVENLRCLKTSISIKENGMKIRMLPIKLEL